MTALKAEGRFGLSKRYYFGTLRKTVFWTMKIPILTQTELIAANVFYFCHARPDKNDFPETPERMFSTTATEP